jgi:hypothetical protein
MAAVPADAWVGEHIGTRVGQAQRVIQLAIGQQPVTGSDRGTANLQHQTSVEIKLQRLRPLHPSGRMADPPQATAF